MSKLLPHPAEHPAQRYCGDHLDCRMDAFEEMMFLGAEFQRAEIIQAAPDCLNPALQVVCRRAARKGPIRVELPPRHDEAAINVEGT